MVQVKILREFILNFRNRVLSVRCFPSRSRFLPLLPTYHSGNLVKATKLATWSRWMRTSPFPIHAP